MKSTILILSAVLTASAAHAAIIEDYEHNNPALYVSLNGVDPYTIDGAAAYSGSFGGHTDSNDFFARPTVATAPGFVYSAMVRAGTGGGRVYMGVGASATGMWTAVFAPNTTSILLQDNAGFGFNEMGETTIPGFAINTWYQLRLLWDVNGDMQVSLYDEPGTTLIAQTAVFSTGFTTPGWLGSRMFDDNNIDDISATAVPEPATLVALGFGIAALAFRRRK